jgi:hypothetical protein
MAETAHSKISEWGGEVANPNRLLATAATYAGLIYSIFGETFCELTVDVGPLMQPAEVLARSEQWFTTALGHMGSGDFDIVSTREPEAAGAARPGPRAPRPGDLDGAAADAARSSRSFVAYATRDNSVRPRWNHVYRQLNVNGYSAVAGVVDVAGRTGRIHRLSRPDDRTRRPPTVNDGVPDPRVPVQFMNEFLQDGVTDNLRPAEVHLDRGRHPDRALGRGAADPGRDRGWGAGDRARQRPPRRARPAALHRTDRCRVDPQA